MRLLKQEAARQGRTMSELVEAALRDLLQRPKPSGGLPEIPTWRSGGARVDVANREALYEAMDR